MWRNDHMGMVALLVGIGGVMGNIVYYFQRSCWEYTYIAHVVHTQSSCVKNYVRQRGSSRGDPKLQWV